MIRVANRLCTTGTQAVARPRYLVYSLQYVSGICIQTAGQLAPACLFIVGCILYNFRCVACQQSAGHVSVCVCRLLLQQGTTHRAQQGWQ